jgi:hypothetical protein
MVGTKILLTIKVTEPKKLLTIIVTELGMGCMDFAGQFGVKMLE